MKERKIEAIVSIDIADFLSQTSHWSAEDTGLLFQHICFLVKSRSWMEIQPPFYVLRRGTAPRPSITAKDRFDVLKAGVCAKCGSTHMLTVDHIIPLALGGAHSRENYQCLCFPCNRKKGATLEVSCG